MNPMYGFDRLRIHTDAVITANRLRDFPVVKDPTPYNRYRRSCIEVHQPTLAQLKELAHELRLHQVEISYAELLADLPIPGDSAQEVLDESLGCLHFAFLPSSVSRFDKTDYVGGRTQRIRVAMYADRPSKFDPREAHLRNKALHIEYRVSGAQSLARMGLSSLRQAIDFDHKRFHDQRTRVLTLPKIGKLGLLLAKESINASLNSPALRKRAREWQAGNCLEGNFCLHNALRNTPGLARKLICEKAFSQWLEELGDGL